MVRYAPLVAAVFFTLWPLVMNRSGLSAIPQVFMYGGVAFGFAFIAMFFTPGAWSELRDSALRLGFIAGVLNLCGALAFTYMLKKWTKTDVAFGILIVIAVQTAAQSAWGLYQAYLVGKPIDLRTICGIVTAALTVYLLGGR